MNASISTVPAQSEDNFPTQEPPSHFRLTPLARAALANGVAFDDVAAYVDGLRRERPLDWNDQ